jgi:sensor histidine kinase regulating citrate/malate metabolism
MNEKADTRTVLSPRLSREGATVTVGSRALEGEGVGFWFHNAAFMEAYLGGSVGFTSTRGEGTTFTVTLPVRPGRSV